MKRFTAVLVIVMMTLTVAYPAFAMGNGMGGHGMMGNWGARLLDWWQKWQGQKRYANPADEQKNRMEELEQKYYRETADLRNAIQTKSVEFDALLNSPNPDMEKVRALHKDISDLKVMLAEKRLNYELEARKINPGVQSGSGYGGDSYAPNMRSYGPGTGRSQDWGE